MATVNIGVTTGTISAPSHPPTGADATALNTLLSATTANTAALTGDLDAVQGVAWSVQSFEALNQVVGIFAAAWACDARTAAMRLRLMLAAYTGEPNPVPTGG